MSQSISDILKGSSNLIKMPENQGDAFDTKNRVGSWVTSGIDEYKKDLATRQWKLVSDTLGKYPELTSSPRSVLSIVNKLLGGNDPNGLIPMPPYMSQEDQSILYQAADSLKNAFNDWTSGRATTDYNILFNALGIGSRVGGLGGTLISEATSALFGDELKKEFEKSRQPFNVVNHRKDELTTPIFNYEQNKSTNKLEVIKNTINTLTGRAPQGVDPIQIISPSLLPNGIDLLGVDLAFKNQHWNDQYLAYSNPLNAKETKGSGTINSYLNTLKSEGLLTGYSQFGGFEIGTNHDWIIKIYPYPHDTEDVDVFKSCERSSVVPALPYYALPNLWGSYVNNVCSPNPDSGKSGGFLSGLKDSVVSSIKNYAQNKIDGLLKGGNDSDITHNQLNTEAFNVTEPIDPYKDTVTYVSFSEYCPVLSYELNLGTMNTDSIKLFNGSSFDVFSGMRYNMTLNLSILDDVYNSMFKYMNQYVNCVYDMATHSLAPYYAMAFDIRLYIFRSGKQINHAYKLIGIPIDFTPRLEGQSDPNECRVDVTFSIIGMSRINSIKVYPWGDDAGNNSGNDGKFGGSTDQNSLSNHMTDLKWDWITVRPHGSK